MCCWRLDVLKQILDIDPDGDDEEKEEGGAVELSAQKKGKCVVIKTSTRQVCSVVCQGFESFILCIFSMC